MATRLGARVAALPDALLGLGFGVVLWLDPREHELARRLAVELESWFVYEAVAWLLVPVVFLLRAPWREPGEGLGKAVLWLFVIGSLAAGAHEQGDVSFLVWFLGFLWLRSWQLGRLFAARDERQLLDFVATWGRAGGLAVVGLPIALGISLLPLGWLHPWWAEPDRYVGGSLIREHHLRRLLLSGFVYFAWLCAAELYRGGSLRQWIRTSRLPKPRAASTSLPM